LCFVCVSGVAYGASSQLEGLSQTIASFVFDFALPGNIG
jgi:hypothetical protein